MNRMQAQMRSEDLVTRTRIVVTCLLHDEGGWWSPSCVESATMPRRMAPLLRAALVRACLVELVRDGHAEVGSAGPGFEPLFRWTQ